MSTEAISYRQIVEQAASGHETATVLVPRSDGTISTGQYTGERLPSGRYVVEVLKPDGQEGYREVWPAGLTDEIQAKLAQQLAMSRPSPDEARLEGGARSVEGGEAVDRVSAIAEDLGGEALKSAGIDEPVSVGSAVISPEYEVGEKSDDNHNKAALQLEAILGSNGKGGGNLGDILRHAGNDPAEIRRHLDKVVGDPALREDVQSMINIRVRALQAKFPLNAQAGKEKSVPAEYGYETAKMDGPDYVAALVMAKLDGSFDYSRETLGGVGEVHDHRDAADMVLGSFAREQVEDIERIDADDVVALLKDKLKIEYSEYGALRAREAQLIVTELLDISYQNVVDTEYADYRRQLLDAKVTELLGSLDALRVKVDGAAAAAEEQPVANIQIIRNQFEKIDSMIIRQRSVIENGTADSLMSIRISVRNLMDNPNGENLAAFRRIVQVKGEPLQQVLARMNKLTLE